LSGHFWNRGGWPACVALVVSVQLLTIITALVFWKPAAVLPFDQLPHQH
jgi:hypothetical protein